MTAPALTPGAWAQPAPPTPTQEFAALLRRLLRQRRMTHQQLASRLHVRHQTVSEWARGIRHPMVHHAPILADALDSPALGYLVRQAARRTCQLCGAAMYQANKGAPRLWCGPQCKAAANDRRQRGATVLDSHLTRNRLQLHQAAVEAMCLACEPDGVCRDAACPLQVPGVSPLPCRPWP